MAKKVTTETTTITDGDDHPAKNSSLEENEEQPGKKPAKGKAKESDDGLVTIKVGGKEKRVSQETADLLEAVKESHGTESAALRAELEALKKPSKTKEEKSNEEDDEYEGLGQEMFLNPGKAVKKIVDKAIGEALSKARGMYTSDQSSKELWNDFYKDHADLKDHDDLVKLTLSKNPKLLQMTVEDSLPKLADMTRNEIKRILKSVGATLPKKSDKNSNRTEVEGSSGSSDASDNETEEDNVVTLGDVIKRRAASRRAARLGQKVAS